VAKSACNTVVVEAVHYNKPINDKEYKPKKVMKEINDYLMIDLWFPIP
jgi:hypothetical protein